MKHLFVALSLMTLASLQAAPVLKTADRVAVIGDSITEQKLYSKFIELYLTVCVPQLDIRCFQFGWGGESASGFLRRMDNDLAVFKPTVATTCYGMNDGGYRRYEESIGKNYENNMAAILAKLKTQGVTVIVGGPGAVDTDYFRRNELKPDVYNDNLAQLNAIARKLAEQNRFPHADVHGAMIAAMSKAKATLGNDYDVCGRDGFHPGPNGHLIMAYAFLKAMGLDGHIGTITVDLTGPTTATDGHTILSAAHGKIECESVRYPFCFSGDDKSSGGTRSIVPFLLFNQDLNRFTLIVKNLNTPRATVTWGKTSKSFTRDQLAAGINLAAEFLDNPFANAFAAVERAVSAKEDFETFMIKDLITKFPALRARLGGNAETDAALETLRRALATRHAALSEAVLAARQPVRHTLQIQPE